MKGSAGDWAPLRRSVMLRFEPSDGPALGYRVLCFGAHADETFMGLLRLRGVECGAPTRYAEAFYGRKVIVGLTG
jgi:hypothetical protein